MTENISFGFSSYSFHSKLSTGEMTLPDVINWVADSEGEHLELAVVGTNGANGPIPSLESDPAYVDGIRTKAEQAGVTLSNMAVSANFFTDEAAREAEVKRVKAYVDLADQLGIKLMRHDVVSGVTIDGDDTPAFEEALPAVVSAAKEIAQYAAGKGITTSLENHGFFIQSADRVRRIVHAVDEKNFKTTLDVGNFVCVDEDPTASVPANLPYAMIVHFKDFYIRPADRNPGEGWFRSRGGKYLRGAIVGNGDLDLWSVAKSIKESAYSGYASIEFEGQEDCLLGCARGIANAKRLIAQA